MVLISLLLIILVNAAVAGEPPARSLTCVGVNTHFLRYDAELKVFNMLEDSGVKFVRDEVDPVFLDTGLGDNQ